MDLCLIKRFYSMLEMTHEQDLRTVMLANNAPTFCHVFDQAILKYGQSNPLMRLQNKQKMTIH